MTVICECVVCICNTYLKLYVPMNDDSSVGVCYDRPNTFRLLNVDLFSSNLFELCMLNAV